VSLLSSDAYSTPMLYRYLYDVPSGSGPNTFTLSTLDLVIVSFLFLSVFLAVLYFGHMFFVKVCLLAVMMTASLQYNVCYVI
jgi:hypothetical protein